MDQPSPFIEAYQTISRLPQPFSSLSTIYENVDFDSEVREICLNKKLGDNSPKVSKMILLGNQAVGKTSLLNRFAGRKFADKYVATIGIDLVCKDFSVLDTPLTLQIWDTAGQERFRSATFQYYRGTNVLVIVFDMTRMDTLDDARSWADAANENGGESENPLLFLVGSKRDLINDIRYEEMEAHAIKIAKEMNAEFWCVSAKTGENVDSLFSRLAALSFQNDIFKRLNKSSLQLHPRHANARARGFSLTGERNVRQKHCCK